jgi:hypothetical protein
MFDNMGINWAGSLLGFIALALIPVPVLLAIYGPKLREKSKFAPSPKPVIVEKPVGEEKTKHENRARRLRLERADKVIR